MSPELYLALAGFAFVTSITPGPNNLMLMASGANFGLRRSLPHMFGVVGGFVVMIVLVGLGLMALIDRVPGFDLVLKTGAVLYMGWLAWKIAHADAPDSASRSGRPLGFWQAAAFQWVNPKAWSMALSAIAAYAPGGAAGGVVAVALVFGAVNLPSIALWNVLGTQLSRLLTRPSRLRAFNWTMAALLLASLVPVLLT